MAKLPAIAPEKILVATFVSSGVANDGGGFIIVNGKFKKVPPRSPSMKKIAVSMQVLSQLEEVEGAEEMKEAAQKTLLSAVEDLV